MTFRHRLRFLALLTLRRLPNQFLHLDLLLAVDVDDCGGHQSRAGPRLVLLIALPPRDGIYNLKKAGVRTKRQNLIVRPPVLTSDQIEDFGKVYFVVGVARNLLAIA